MGGLIPVWAILDWMVFFWLWRLTVDLYESTTDLEEKQVSVRGSGSQRRFAIVYFLLSEKMTCLIIALLLIGLTEGVNYFSPIIIIISIQVKRVKPPPGLPGNCKNVFEEGITYFGEQVSTHWSDRHQSLSVYFRQISCLLDKVILMLILNVMVSRWRWWRVS